MPGWILLFALIALSGTWLARQYALRTALIDEPGERRSHVAPTPRGGGIAMVIAVMVAIIALAWREPAQRLLLAVFGVGFGLVALIGWIDDHRPLSARLRLCTHIAAAALFSCAFGALTGAWSWAWLGFGLMVVLTNVWNFMDGIDGIATTQALLVAASLAVVAPGPWSALALALCGACIGFLPFNWPRARIFMGDVGSGALGFALGALVLVACTRLIEVRPVVNVLWLLPLSAFLVDASLTLARRLVRRERWWTAHAQHAYQVWARARGHVRVTLAYAGWTVGSVVLAFALRDTRPVFMLASVMAWYTAAAFAWLVLQKQPVFDPRGAPSTKDSG